MKVFFCMIAGALCASVITVSVIAFRAGERGADAAWMAGHCHIADKGAPGGVRKMTALEAELVLAGFLAPGDGMICEDPNPWRSLATR